MEILPGIHRIGARYNERYIASYLLLGERAALVDSGYPWIATETILPYLEKVGLPAGRLDWLIVTHASSDHHGGNHTIRSRYPDVTIVAHRLDADAMLDGAVFLREHVDILAGYGFFPDVLRPDDPRFRQRHGEPAGVDWRVEGGEQIALSAARRATLLHAPGHTPGHLMVYEPQQRALIAGDALLGAGVPDIHGKLVMPPHYFEVAWYRSTIAAARALSPEYLLATHYAPLAGAAVREFLVASETFLMTCDATILAILERAPQPLDMPAIIQALRDALGIPGADYQYALLVRAHLRNLTQAGRIVRHSAGAAPRWAAP